MMQKVLGGLLHLLKRLRQWHAQALLTKRAMKSLDKRVQIGTMRRAHIGLDTHTQQKPHQGGGEIASTGAAHKARIIVKGEHGGQAMLA